MRYRTTLVSNVDEYLNQYHTENRPKSIAKWKLHSVVPMKDHLNYMVIWEAEEGTEWIEQLVASKVG